LNEASRSIVSSCTVELDNMKNIMNIMNAAEKLVQTRRNP